MQKNGRFNIIILSLHRLRVAKHFAVPIFGSPFYIGVLSLTEEDVNNMQMTRRLPVSAVYC